MIDSEILEYIGAALGAFALGYALSWVITTTKKALDHI